MVVARCAGRRWFQVDVVKNEMSDPAALEKGGRAPSYSRDFSECQGNFRKQR